MAGIGNIIGAYNLNPKRISSKLSFEVGQVFLAKIVASSDLSKELILRLLDGWQFPAKLQKPLDFIPEGLIKLEVEGFQDGQLQVKLVNSNNNHVDSNKDSIENLLLQENIDVDKADYDILKNMIKHNMPLTKENISNVKTIFDFRDKLFKDEVEEKGFILKYISSKDIDPDSIKGKEIKENLEGFFKELKNISEDEILTMLENNIDLTEDNIKSFIKVNKQTSIIYKELVKLNNEVNKNLEPEIKDLKPLLSKIKESPNYKEEIVKVLKGLEQKLENTSLNNKELELYEGLKKIIQDNNNEEKDLDTISNLIKPVNGNMEESFEAINPKSIELFQNENEDYSIEINIEDKNNLKNEVNIKDIKDNSDIKYSSNLKDNKDDSNIKNMDTHNMEDENSSNKEIHNKVLFNSIKSNLSLSKRELESLVKEQLSVKTEEMKNIIKTFLDKTEKSRPEIYERVVEAIKGNINDFKVFNSISNQYYYLDIPVNLNKEDYNCKLLIKDDRKSGKKIDSQNVSMVISVNTSSLGTIDAYIKVRNQNMSVNIKCEESLIKFLTSGKNKIMKELNELGYNSFLNVEKREKEVNISNCRDFFDDSSLNSINVKV